MRAAACFAIAVLSLLGGGPATAASAPLALSSPSVAADGAIDARASAYGANLSPALAWPPVRSAEAWAVILDDPDAGASPFVHWLIWNIPGRSSGLDPGLPRDGDLKSPAGARQGRNGAGGLGYFGPMPPSGVHHYHFRLYALDRPLDLASGATRVALDAAMKGHVLATAELVGAFAAPNRH